MKKKKLKEGERLKLGINRNFLSLKVTTAPAPVWNGAGLWVFKMGKQSAHHRSEVMIK